MITIGTPLTGKSPLVKKAHDILISKDRSRQAADQMRDILTQVTDEDQRVVAGLLEAFLVDGGISTAISSSPQNLVDISLQVAYIGKVPTESSMVIQLQAGDRVQDIRNRAKLDLVTKEWIERTGLIVEVNYHDMIAKVRWSDSNRCTWVKISALTSA